MNEEDSAEEISESQPPPRRSRRVKRRLVCIYNTEMVDVEGPRTYEEAMRSSKKIEWNMVLKEESESFDRNHIWTEAVFQLCKDVIPCKAVVKR